MTIPEDVKTFLEKHDDDYSTFAVHLPNGDISVVLYPSDIGDDLFEIADVIEDIALRRL